MPHNPFPDPAAVLPGEAEMLAAVLADLTDDLPKLVYADWLEERNDPRGEHLRAFVLARQAGRKLPTPYLYAHAWCEMTGVLFEERIRDHDLLPYREKLLALARPALELNDVQLTDESEIPLNGCKLGGLPALPPGTPWPRCDKGHLRFYAQFDLSVLARSMAGRVLPPAGLLSFFEYQNWRTGEHGPPAVLFTPPDTELVLLDPPGDLDDDCGRPHRPATFTVRESLDFPAWTEPWEEKLGVPMYTGQPELREVSDRFWNFINAQREVTHVLFGYSRPRRLEYDPIPGPEWEQLISFASDRTLNWDWYYGHELFWHIRTDDLKAGRFDRTEAHNG
jgi:uncharacterized protein (TIGR02996 family)